MESYQHSCDSQYYSYDCETNMNNFTDTIIIEDNGIPTMNMTNFTISNMVIWYFKFLLDYYPLIIIAVFTYGFVRTVNYLVERRMKVLLKTFVDSVNTNASHINDINECLAAFINSMNELELELAKHNIAVKFDTMESDDDSLLFNEQLKDIKTNIMTCFEPMTIDQLRCNKDSILHIKKKFNAFHISRELRVYAFLHTMYNRFMKSIVSTDDYESFTDYLIDETKTRVTIDTRNAIKELFNGAMYENSIEFFVDNVIM